MIQEYQGLDEIILDDQMYQKFYQLDQEFIAKERIVQIRVEYENSSELINLTEIKHLVFHFSYCTKSDKIKIIKFIQLKQVEKDFDKEKYLKETIRGCIQALYFNSQSPLPIPEIFTPLLSSASNEFWNIYLKYQEDSFNTFVLNKFQDQAKVLKQKDEIVIPDEIIEISENEDTNSLRIKDKNTQEKSPLKEKKKEKSSLKEKEKEKSPLKERIFFKKGSKESLQQNYYISKAVLIYDAKNNNTSCRVWKEIFEIYQNLGGVYESSEIIRLKFKEISKKDNWSLGINLN